MTREQTDKTKILLPLVLFILTIGTTTASGALFEGVNPLRDPYGMIKGIPFSFSLLLILGLHELGHWFTSRYHGVVTTLPTFIPGPPIPPLVGTFGAIIKIKSPITTKKALVQIGAAGPLAGFVVAVVVTIIGLRLSWYIPNFPTYSTLVPGDSILFKLLREVFLGPRPAGHILFVHPVLYAGWFGLLLTCLNLLPVGQLDGGHILYAVNHKNHHVISICCVLFLGIMGFFTWYGWIFWAVLVTIIGLRHPPTMDAHIALDRSASITAVASLVVFVLTFTPTPFYIN